MKRIASLALALLLTASLLLGVLPAASAADSLTEAQRAVMETAVAYLHRGPYVQYDSTPITAQGKYLGDGGDIRETDFVSPEDATADNIMFSVCSAYCFEVYYDAFGYKMLGDPLTNKTNNLTEISADDPLVVLKYDDTGKDTSSKVIKDRKEALAKMHDVMQPGDWVVAWLGGSGHAMLYAGNYLMDQPCVIHCAGGKYSMETGNDMVEKGGSSYKHNGGAIRYDTVEKFLFADKPGYAINTARRIVVLRPLNVLKASQLTPAAKTRLKYTGLDIDRSASVSRFGSVETGDEITITLNIKNWSDKDYTGLPVTETVPANAALKSGSVKGGGSTSGNTIKWSLDVPAGKTATLSYTVTATGKRGDTIEFAGGTVGDVRSNQIPVTIGGKGLTSAQEDKLLKIAGETSLKGYQNEEFINAAYATLFGVDPKLPSVTQIAKNFYDRENVEGADLQMLIRKQTVPAEYAKTEEMMIPLYVGGQLVKTGGNGHARVLDVANEKYLQPGDVVLAGKNIFAGKSGTYVAYLYLGDNKIAFTENNRLKLEKATSLLGKLLTFDYFVGLRPSLAYDNMTLEAKAEVKQKLPFTDVKESDWFYSFVSELYSDGTVNGMTATTFVPNGNLTYGQALKLIVCALGYGEQAKTGGHWASGYLAFALDKGWIAGEVHLDDPISRLNFCKIAAKAKNLTAQPENNKFTDTSDADVLALVSAGVINGMSETTFAPDTTLTRAQISKIISLLRKL